MNFKTHAHETYFERVQATAMEVSGGLGRHPDEPSLLVNFGGSQLHIDVLAWGPLDAKVRIVVVVGRLSSTPEEALADAKRLLELSASISLASFAIDEWGNIIASTELLGSSCSHDALRAGLTAVALAKETFEETFGERSSAQSKPQATTPVIGETPPAELMRRIELDSFEIYYCIRGLPVSVHEIVEAFAAGRTEDEVLTKYPDLQQADLDAARRFAAHYPEKVQQGFEPKEEPEPEPEPTPSWRPAPKPLSSRIAPDDMGLYYSIRGLPISVSAVREKLDQGLDDAAILELYPALEADDLEAVRGFDGPPL